MDAGEDKSHLLASLAVVHAQYNKHKRRKQ